MEGTSRAGLTEEYMCIPLCSSSEDENDISHNEEPTERSSIRPKFQRPNSMQILALERFFEQNQHPSPMQRQDLSRRLGLNQKQVKYWFQNKRTQLKAQNKKAIKDLQKEMENLRKETLAMKAAMENQKNKECEGPSSSTAGLLLQMENADLKKDLKLAYGVITKLTTNPNSSDLASSSTQLNLSLGGPHSIREVPPYNAIVASTSSSEDRNSKYLEKATAAMNEFIVLTEKDSPFWLKTQDGENEVFNEGEYDRMFGCVKDSPKFVCEATRATGLVAMSGVELHYIMMHRVGWAGMFISMVGNVFVIEVLYKGVAGTHDGELLMMNAELLFPSPLVPLREIRFLRYCKKQPNGWMIVDVSIDPIRADYADVYKRCRMLPSGCIIESLPEGNSLVTFLEHYEYDESIVHSLLRPAMRSGSCFGAERWLATMQRHCECIALRTALLPPDFPIEMTMEGRTSVMFLMNRVAKSVCFGICDTKLQKWERLSVENIPPNTKLMTRTNLFKPGEYPGIMLSLSTSKWIPIQRNRVFDFLSNPRTGPLVDLFANSGPFRRAIQIHNNSNFSDTISLMIPHPSLERMRRNALLQHSWCDRVSSNVVITLADLQSISAVLKGAYSDFVKIIPTGFIINDCTMESRNGSLLTVGAQFPMSEPSDLIIMDAVQTMSGRINTAFQRIQAALVGGDQVVA